MTSPSKLSELTIVSRFHLRATYKEWEQPQSLFLKLGGPVLEALINKIGDMKFNYRIHLSRRALLLFEVMLRVIDEPPLIKPLVLSTKRFQELQLLFYGALGSQKFCALSELSRLPIIYRFYQLMLAIQDDYHFQLPDYQPALNKMPPQPLIDLFDSTPLNGEEVSLLRPYFLTSKSGINYNVLLRPMLSVMGKEFTDRFHEGLRQIARPKAKDAALRDFGTSFASFLNNQANHGKLVTPVDLLQSDFVQSLLVDFMEFHFTKILRMQGGPQEGTLSYLQKRWSKYSLNWKKLSDKKILAAPQTAFPAGNTKLFKHGELGHRRTRLTESGTSELITNKLVTPVPLHVTDEQATKLVFEQIKKDFHVVQLWLKRYIDKLWEDYQEGLRVGSEMGPLPSDEALIQLTNPTRCNNALGFALKYFQERHGGYTDTIAHSTLAFPLDSERCRVSKRKLSRLLGLPSSFDAMAQLAYLASVDGRFSLSALSTALLFDQHGKRINAVNSDSGITISVLKERNASDGWADVILRNEAAASITRWIELSAPIRRYMKDNAIEGWQNLFVYTGSPIGGPSIYNRTSNINTTFRNFALNHKEALGDLANTLTIPRIRSTRGVLVFLETMDIHAMAKELGNSSGTSMRHYLPDSLWEYFANRWLRIFQNLLVVEATKDTPYLQRALNFKTADELDEFLKNQAIRPLIPIERIVDSELPAVKATADNGGKPNNRPVVSEVMIAASRGIFAVLLSIKGAVQNASASGLTIHEKALYWSEFAICLERHIESNTYRDRSIKKLLKEAAHDASPESYMRVVCATS